MKLRAPAQWCALCAAGVLTTTLGTTEPAQALIELVGVNQATLEWSAASGPVEGYNVYLIAADGSERLHGAVVGVTRTTIRADFGTSLRISVAAFDASGAEGPRSRRSERIEFVAAPPAPPPAEDPPAGDPPGDAPPMGEDPEIPGSRADFDGDGTSDVLVRNRANGLLRVLRMNGAEVVGESDLPALPLGFSIAGTADFDGDGRFDVLCQNDETGALELWLTGSGELTVGDPLSESLAQGWSVIESGDVDGDGRADVVVRSPGVGLEVWHMNGDQVLGIDAFEDLGGDWVSLPSGDHDGDGRVDLVFAADDLRMWRSTGTGFEDRTLARFNPDATLVDVGDFDGDGADEMLFWFDSLRLLVTASVADSRLADIRVLNHGRRRLAHLASGDFDADGREDIVVEREGEGPRILFMGPAGVDQDVPFDALTEGWEVLHTGD